jgi:hypothetical protein
MGCVQSFVDFFHLTHRPEPKTRERHAFWETVAERLSCTVT